MSAFSSKQCGRQVAQLMMKKDILLNGASPMKLYQGFSASNQKIKFE
jgi:hypothetical protein